MKTITQFITAILVAAALPITGSAQDLGNAVYEKGFQLSQESGVMAKLNLWKKSGGSSTKDNILEVDPKKQLLSKYGIRQSDTHAPNADYDFFGGEITKGNNVPLASITDAGGNTYITGSSSNIGQPAGDWFTLKVGPDGAILWEKREPAVKYAVEHGMALVFNNEGDLVVTGVSWNGSDTDIRTIKYKSGDGSKSWEKIYDGGAGLDIPSAIVADSHGNTYIAGISYADPEIVYITLKYDNDGNLLWGAEESDGLWNEATAIAVDNDGNVIVTGWNPDADGWANYHTVKYDSNGEQLWVQTYNYPSTDPDNESDVTNSVPYAVTTDDDGNVYVTGEFDTFLSRFGTIKYNAGGIQQWIATYKVEGDRTEAYKIAVKDGAVYVCGTHRGGFSDDGNVLISYSPEGEENWIVETNDLIDAFDPVLLFDAAGNPVVAAYGMTPGAEEWQQDVAARAKKYAPDGELLGEAAFVIVTSDGTASMTSMAGAGLDDQGNVYFAVNSFYSADGAVYEAVKSAFAEEAPEPLWNTVYTNLGNPMASMLYSFPDHNGNTLSTGQYYNFADGMLLSNYFIIQHDADGNITWEKVYNAENGAAANGIIGRADEDGNVYVALLPDFDQTAIRIKKLTPTGEELWETQVDLINAQLYVLEPGPDGSLYMGGTAYENEGDTHASVAALKLNSSGGIVWTSYLATANAGDNIYSISSGKVDQDGNMVLTGMSGSGTMMSQDVDLTVVKFNTNGSSAWIAEATVGSLNSTGTDLLIAEDGTIYTNGFAQHPVDGAEDIVTAKISTEGEVLWTKTFGAANRNERSYTIRKYSTGEVAVIGYSLAPNGDIHNTLIKYSAEGEELWDFASQNMRYYNSFHLDGSDKCYIMNQEIINVFPDMMFTGYFPRPTLVTVEPDGTDEEQFFIGPEYAQFFGQELVPHEDDRLLLGGSLNNQSFFEGVYFFETIHDGTAGLDEHGNATTGNSLGQNYPNPVTATTEIPFYLADGGKAVIRLYNVTGRLVKEIANDTFVPGENVVKFDAAGLSEGIYYYQITTGKFKQSRKMAIKK